jgi:hypothetical protein
MLLEALNRHYVFDKKRFVPAAVSYMIVYMIDLKRPQNVRCL